MKYSFTILLLSAAGVAVVFQNLLMVRISETAPTVLIALVINSAMGLMLLFTALLVRSGLTGIAQTVAALRPWSFLPGLLGSFFVLAGLIGYQRVGAAATISILVASQLIAGLILDASKSGVSAASLPDAASIFGAALLVAGVILLLTKRV